MNFCVVEGPNFSGESIGINLQLNDELVLIYRSGSDIVKADQNTGGDDNNNMTVIPIQKKRNLFGTFIINWLDISNILDKIDQDF